MTKTVRVVAHVVAYEDQVENLKKVLFKLVEATRKEHGCIQYDLCQAIDKPTDFTFVEEWESKEALDAHLAGENLQIALKEIEGKVAAGPDIRICAQIA